MRKTYILDTSVLIHDPNSFKSFHGNDVIIPISVLGELDKLKTFPNEAGKNARVSVRMLDDLTKNGDIIKGIKIDNDILVKIDASVATDQFGDPGYADNQILWCAYSTRQNKKNKKSPTVLVSKDINLRVRARALDILAEDYEADKNPSHELYVGYRTIVNDDLGTDLFTKEMIDCSDYQETMDLHPNECVHVESSDGRGIALARKVGDKLKLIKSQKPWGLASRNKEQAMAIDLIMDKSVPLVSLIGSAGTGKAQPLDADVLTPDGFKKMGSLKVGDLVSTPDGKSAPIVGIFPQGEKDIYKVSFSDGTSTECCEDHLWLTKTSEERGYERQGKVRDTKEIARTLNCGKDNVEKNHSIPIAKAIEFSKKNLSTNSYDLGLSLNKNSFVTDHCIPNEYKYSSVSDRIELLQGLLDAAGTVNELGEIEYCSVNTKLAEDFCWVVESLGGTATAKIVKNSHRITVALPNEIIPFKSEKKLSRIAGVNKTNVTRYITGVNLVGKKQAQCIMIDHPDHLYLTNNFIVTHNTLVTVASALELVLEKKVYQKLIVYRPIHTVGKDLGFLPGPQPLDAKVLTPAGWTTMGELSIGSEVISRDGKKTNVLGIYPKGTKSVYRVTTTDGSSTECCEDHLWLTKTWEDKKRGRSGSVKATKEIYETLRNKNGKINHYIPRNEPVQFNEQEVSTKPYLIGRSVVEKDANEKFIPDTYKYNSIKNRINLLHGLMDAAGIVGKNGEAFFTTTSLRLANDVVEIVKSLGGNANLIPKSSDIYKFRISLPQNMNPFHIGKKSSRYVSKNIRSVGIQSIDYVGEKPVQCILVENPEHLYITDNFIVTHNTLDEKLGPQVVALNDTFEFLLSSQKGDKWKLMLDMYKQKGVIEIDAIAYVRGRSIPNALIIIDECQNISKQEMKTLLSRLSEGSKCVVLGDTEQIDNPSLDAMDNGLTRVVETFKSSKLSGHITLTKGERSELATEVAKML